MKSTADILLQKSEVMLAPLVRTLIQQGITYPQFSAVMKQVFMEMARMEIQSKGQRETDSAVSVLSGVHRKDVRAFGTAGSAQITPSLTLAAQIFTRWITDPSFKDKRNRPAVLQRTGTNNSFDVLATTVSKDVHPRTALEELIRLGIATLNGDRVRLKAGAFVPGQGFEETASLFSHNVADHIAAGARNLTQQNDAKLLEQSIFAKGLTADSTDQLGIFARELWSELFQKMVPEAEKLVARDIGEKEATQRMRVGMYFFSDNDQTMPIEVSPVAQNKALK